MHRAAVLFLGPEEGERQAAVAELRDAMRERHGDGLEEHSFYAFETPASDVVQVLQNGSLFGSASFVRYRSVEHLKKKEDVAALASYLAAPNESALLVLESSETRVAKPLEDAVGQKHKRIFWEMFDDQKHGWLMGYFRRHKVQIPAEAVDLMLELVQNNTRDLRQEADRLISYVGHEISLDDVDRYMYHAREESVFSLFDAMMDGDLDHALDITDALVVDSEPVQILIGLGWQIDRLYLLQMLRSSGISDGSLFSALQKQTGQAIRSKRLQRNLLQAAERYTPADCAAIKVLTGEIDALLRTVPSAYHRTILHQYLYGVVSRRGAWSPTGSRRAVKPWEFPALAV